MMSAVGIIGYYGTTSLRMIKTADWVAFESGFFSSGQRGEPYEFVGTTKEPRQASDKTVYFDSRLIDMLTYLANGPANKANCPGWTNFGDPKHDKIKLDIDSSDADSDLYTQPDNPPSVSTIHRGVGVRIAGADKVKCTVFYPNPDPHIGCREPIPMKFYEFDILFDEGEGFLSPRPAPPRPAGVCKIECGVNRFPDRPRDVLPEEWNVSEEIAAEKPRPYSTLNPGVFQYEELSSKARDIAIYKETQIAYAILSIDKADCASEDGLDRNDKLIPFSMIFPEWMYKELETTSMQGGSASIWDDLTNIARNVNTQTGGKQERGGYLANWQDRSPLAGVSWDPETVDRYGTSISPARSSPLEILHVNY